MFIPKKTKYRKAFKGRIHGDAKGGFGIAFGSYALKALRPVRLSPRQIEAGRKCITRTLKRTGKIWIRVFPSIPVSKKPADVRMGKGKGSVEYWAFRVHPGHAIFEISDVPRELAKLALLKAAAKLPGVYFFDDDKDKYE